MLGITKTLDLATIEARSGTVELAWGSQVFGANNIGGGAFGFIGGGMNNILAGDFGAMFGRDNVGGYANITAGWNNINLAALAAVFGQNHIVDKSSGQLVSGLGNLVRVWNGVALGRYLKCIDDNAETVIGQLNAEVNKRPMLIIGNGTFSGETPKEGDEVIEGYKAVRSNAFVVYYDGDAEVMQDLFVKRNAVITGTIATAGTVSGKKFNAGSNNNINGNSTGSAFGDGHTLNSNQTLSNGYKNTHNSSCTFSNGTGLQADMWCQSVFGKYNKPNTSDVLIVGWGSEGSPKNIMTLSQSGVLDVLSGIKIGGKDIVDLVAEKVLKTLSAGE